MVIQAGALTARRSMRPHCPLGSNAAAWWAQADHRDRLPQGSLPRFVLHRPQVFRDVLRLTISRGQLANIIAKVSQALEQPYEELLESLPDQVAQRRRDWSQAKPSAAVDLVLSGRAVHVLQDRPVAQRRCADRGSGRGVQRRPGL